MTSHGDGLAGGVLCGFPADLSATASLADLLRGAVEGGMGEEPFDALSAYNEPFQPARTGFDWLSRDPDEVDKYVADPLCGDDNPLTYGYVLGLFDVVSPAGERLSSIGCPVFVIAGDQDPAGEMGVSPTKLADALRAAGVDVELRLYEGARHELLNETNRDEVTADLVSWFDGRVG
jgi:alpha-beta hydrolase superfamily lysophospholipase